MYMFLPLMMMLSLLFLFMNHPLTCGFILLIQTILTALISGLMNINFWYSYILFLIMVGGMLILFIYMTSIVSNEKFKINPKLSFLMTLLMLYMIILLMDKFYLNMNNQIFDMNSQNLMYFHNLSMIKYFNKPNYLMMLIIIIYLFITLIAVVKITNINYGSLRQKF
uniref:NADH-ubiquinone oxidoreductase chain 6 n=1 Tax=Monolepta hieroglyphica TaxID=327932 RepID=A0A891T7J2_9CUCU|nr:NADH dehydrogenase subunit 6 [Monolepta hieroglyphica]QRM91332.1 NADH dehydrogenase subunit 6 [Monolepta hieroglyphica]